MSDAFADRFGTDTSVQLAAAGGDASRAGNAPAYVRLRSALVTQPDVGVREELWEALGALPYAQRGFELPAPTVDASGQYTFDLEKASPRWGSDHWYRTLFVNCAGALPAP
jgi:hypothetical protein